jgi:phosphoribosylanthranilate isomerase
VTKVKICGITTLEDAMTCVEAGADALGFIFVENTPRFIAPADAAPIIRRLPPFVTAVGVFWDHPAGHVKAVAEACRLGALQFHGAESPEDLAQYVLPVIKTIKVSGPQDLARLPAYRERVAAFLLDSAARWSEGEPRQPIEWRLAGMAMERIILSAGLTPDNVARAVSIARPYAVDVNSGVEGRPGRKDPDKVWRFIAEARRAQ